ncbi:MAG: hypothetical protein LBM77_12750, partial [Spirochaetaceae bacterium]|nr:hypothetical protein [Spirochaetaceae bacterium]
GGMNRGFTKEPYPSPAIQKALSERGVPYIVTADAHRAVDLDGGYGRVTLPAASDTLPLLPLRQG